VEEVPFHLIANLSLGDKLKALDAIVSLASEDPSMENHIIKLPFTTRVYKTLVQGGHYNVQEQRVEGKYLNGIH
jgi:hypothetical protein